MKKYTCLECGVEKYSREQIRDHIKEEHGATGLSPDEKPHSRKTDSKISKKYTSTKMRIGA